MAFVSSAFMNESNAYCPRCGKMVTFLKASAVATCPACGFKYELSEPRLPAEPSLGSAAIGVLGVLLRVFLIMVVLAVVTLAVVFAGCALMFR